MTDDKRIEEKKKRYREYANQSGAVGRIPVTRRPNFGGHHDEPREVLDYFRGSHEMHEKVQEEAVKIFGRRFRFSGKLRKQMPIR